MIDPAKLDIDPVTGNVYVLNTNDRSVTVIQGTKVLTTVTVGWGPYELGVNPADGRLYVSNSNVDTVSVLGVE